MINSFNKKTPQAVKDALLDAQARNVRVQLWLGDTKTGKLWLEEHDIFGRISNSTGPQKVAILINNSRSTGGGAILDHCILKIQETVSKRVLYANPKRKLPNMEIRASDLPEYRKAVYVNGELQARFKTEKSARRYVNIFSTL